MESISLLKLEIPACRFLQESFKFENHFCDVKSLFKSPCWKANNHPKVKDLNDQCNFASNRDSGQALHRNMRAVILGWQSLAKKIAAFAAASPAIVQAWISRNRSERCDAALIALGFVQDTLLASSAEARLFILSAGLPWD